MGEGEHWMARQGKGECRDSLARIQTGNTHLYPTQMTALLEREGWWWVTVQPCTAKRGRMVDVGEVHSSRKMTDRGQ